MTSPDTPAAQQPPIEVVRSEERLVTATRWRRSGSVRIAKRVVEEERTFTVTLRREELVVEHLPADDLSGAAEEDGGAVDVPADPGPQPVVEIVLSHEVVEPHVVVEAHELVRVNVERVRGSRRVVADVAHEVVDLTDVQVPDQEA